MPKIRPKSRQGSPRPEWFGTLLGIGTFLLGVALLWQTFQWAHGLFTQPAEEILKIDREQGVDLGVAGQSLLATLQRVLVLVLMAGVGAIIATRGVRLYLAARTEAANPPIEMDEEDEPRTARAESATADS